MTLFGPLQFVVFLLIVTALVRPLGSYLARVFEGQWTLLDPVCLPLERGDYRLAGIDPRREMGWAEYAGAFLRFSVLGMLLLYIILRLNAHLPWFDGTYMTTPMSTDLALNTAVSFATTTTWQAYAGEATLSYSAQMVGLVAQNFLAGASGLAVGVAFIRGFARRGSSTLGNFWRDLVRAVLWVLLPAALLMAVVLMWQRVPMNFADYTVADGLTGSQVIAQGPVAALETVKNLGTNGGGFFNANGAHPFENPSSFTNAIEMLAIVALPAALTYTFGTLTGRRRDAWLLYIVMVVLFSAGLLLTAAFEQGGNPLYPETVSQSSTDQPGGNMEGKETRFGIASTALTVTATSNAATGSYNAMHDSLTPLGGAVPLVNMQLGKLVFGGLGTGIYSMVIVALLAMFVTGLMIGRTPAYLGKRIGPAETRLVTLYILIGPAAILGLTAVAVVSEAGLRGLTTNDGAHGFTEILYAYASSVANNGQNFAGLSANTWFYNVTTAIGMLAGRFGLAVVALAIAGYMVRQPTRQATAGTFPTASPLFALVLTATILIVGLLTFLPALALGPLAEHLTAFQK